MARLMAAALGFTSFGPSAVSPLQLMTVMLALNGGGNSRYRSQKTLPLARVVAPGQTTTLIVRLVERALAMPKLL